MPPSASATPSRPCGLCARDTPRARSCGLSLCPSAAVPRASASTGRLVIAPASALRAAFRLLSRRCGCTKMKVKILKWHGMASWTWDAQDETCGICRMAFDGCCPDCAWYILSQTHNLPADPVRLDLLVSITGTACPSSTAGHLMNRRANNLIVFRC
ncbi:hypothetical protein E2562_017437 [Oryza meyeriana var. granulata]|uniref:Anaphase-promoting complex subunit 11 RING-H2 finger domain-containing protein n=1 Tax=Oryza meyeriana var. granulata TaxID=110450 RepID=A0A6G1DXC3_9ORYZ|nr:hypothetical protein E2562_017437 [Oryza meyeriana var. granulata]